MKASRFALPDEAPRSDPRRRLTRGDALTALICVTISVWWFLCSRPVATSDTGSFFQLALSFRHGQGFASDLGTRPLAFPLWMALLGASPRAIFAGNILALLLTAWALHEVFRLVSGSRLVAHAAALAYVLNPSTLWFAGEIMPEVLTSALIVGSLLWLLRASRQQEHRGRVWFATLSGSAMALAALTKPLFQLLWVVAILWLLIPANRRRVAVRIGWASILGILLSNVLLIGGWIAFNASRFDYATVSTLTGYNLTQHAAPWLEDARPQDTQIAHVYMHYRDRKIAQSGTWSGSIWPAIPELRRKTGLSYPQLSKRMAAMCTSLILTHPAGYVASVARSMVLFWMPAPYYPGYRLSDFLHGRSPRLVYGYALVYLIAVASYFVGLVVSVVWPRLRARLWSAESALIHAVIWYTAIVSSMTEFGENARYKFPVEGLVIGWAVFAISRLVGEWRARHTASV